MRLSGRQIVAAVLTACSPFAFVLSCTKPDQSTATPTIVVHAPAKPEPRVEHVLLRANEYLTNPLLVEVTGRDFVWHFRYSGPDGMLNTSDDVSTSEELHLPSEHDVRFVVRSEDYIYYMSIPDLSLRQISVPELTFEKLFRTTKTGVFEMPADPMCGAPFFHDGPMGRVVMQRKSRFIDWLSGFGATTFEVNSTDTSSSR